jgi:fimbrial chaperone protein
MRALSAANVTRVMRVIRALSARQALSLLAAAFACCLGVSPAQAATLQISPVMIDMSADANATGITLKNPGEKPMYGQVRVFRWEQANGEDVLTPTQDVVASPPLIQIAGNGDQLVRLVRTTPAPSAAEQSYRVLIDELPEPDAAPTSGVTIRLRYSVPVFVEPGADLGQPRLAWHLSRGAQNWTLQVENTGKKRAQIAAVQLVDTTGKTYPINKGLLGYALAGHGRRWPVDLPANVAQGGPLRVRASVNSLPAEAAVNID